jgi:recombination protein RecR
VATTPQTSGAIARLIQEFTRLPGIGPKSAERITHYLLSADRKQVAALAEALATVRDHIRHCRQCHNLTEHELCSICSDPRRDRTIICVIEQPRDLAALEKTATFRGVYHVLHGKLAPLENVGPEQLTIDALLSRVQAGGVEEIIMATNPTLEGDGTALYISNVLASTGVRVTRLARGLPSGSVLEFANNQMLTDALEGRRSF